MACKRVNWQVLVKTEQNFGFHRLSITAPICFSIAILHHGVNNLLSSLETSVNTQSRLIKPKTWIISVIRTSAFSSWNNTYSTRANKQYFQFIHHYHSRKTKLCIQRDHMAHSLQLECVSTFCGRFHSNSPTYKKIKNITLIYFCFLVSTYI